jgi:hypothetical protein
MSAEYPQIAKAIHEAARIASQTPLHPEGKLRQLVQQIWDDAIRANHINIHFHPKDERALANGRPDTVYNQLIIEYKKPGVIKPGNAKNRQLIAQVEGYIEDLAKEERWKEDRLLGVAIDGRYFLYIRKVGRWLEEKPVPVSAESVEKFLLTLEKLTSKAALVPENLISDFAVGAGARNFIASNAIRAFYFALTGNVNERVKAFFDQWALQFSEVHGAIENKKFDAETLFASYGFKKQEQVNFNFLAFFFALDTYFGLLMKLLAYQVVGFYTLKEIAGLPLADWEKLDSDSLKEKLAEMEEGGIFRQLGIRNLLEGDLLSWYLNDWNKAINAAVCGIIERLNQYDPETLELIPDETRDILKKLYQFLVPKQIRHDLGEYYTPDWLAERCLNQVDYGVKDRDLLKKRLLDPGCGSGTFIILAIKRARENARLYGIDPATTLSLITQNLFGFDLNPIAVIAARTNYLLAIADLLKHKRSEVTIPIYLCDSINPPRAKEQASLFDDPEAGIYPIPTTVGMFRFPKTLVQRDLILAATNLLEDAVKRGLSREKFIERAQTELKTEDNRGLADTYDQLLDLERKGINGVWARIIKNAFAPLFVGEFDFIAGNPPWVNWESLPQQYRDTTAPIWQRYNLFEQKGLRARLGSAKDDISVLMTYVAIDKYLKDKGKLCFVITQSVFKTVGGGEGFRRFQLGKNGPHFKILQVDDMVELQPFDSATNRTAVFVCQKGDKTEYPVEYDLWRKKEKGTIGNDLTWKDVQGKTVVRQLKAQSVDGSAQGPWITAKPKALHAIKTVIGNAAYTARAGAYNGGLSGAYWVNITQKEKEGAVRIANLYDDGKIKVEPVEQLIESSIVFPLLRWSDMSKWSYSINNAMLIPHLLDNFDKPIPPNKLPKFSAEYFSKFEKLLKDRALYKKFIAPTGAPFYAIYDIGPYTLSLLKVCWQTMGEKLRAVVVSSSDIKGFLRTPKPIIPQHTIAFIPLSALNEAHYLCAMLNTALADFVARSYSMGKSFGSPHILEYIKIPKYDENNAVHNDLSSLSKRCHEKAAVGIDVGDLEEQIDALAAELWGLTKEELKEIKESLEEMR